MGRCRGENEEPDRQTCPSAWASRDMSRHSTHPFFETVRRRKGNNAWAPKSAWDDYEMMAGVSDRPAPPSTGFDGRPRRAADLGVGRYGPGGDMTAESGAAGSGLVLALASADRVALLAFLNRI
jgi:hypothetical protein